MIRHGPDDSALSRAVAAAKDGLSRTSMPPDAPAAPASPGEGDPLSLDLDDLDRMLALPRVPL